MIDVAHLIFLLKKHSDDLQVVVRGYEGGVEELEVTGIRLVKIIRDKHKNSSVYGEHEIDFKDGTEYALLLDRRQSEYNRFD